LLLHNWLLTLMALGSILGGHGHFLTGLKRPLSVKNSRRRFIEARWLTYVMRNQNTHSQLGQELLPRFIEDEFQVKIAKTFFEAGACNGIVNSNTYSLESTFGWRGVLVEPNPIWHSELFATRNPASVFTAPLVPSSGMKVVLELCDNPQMTRIAGQQSDWHTRKRLQNLELMGKTFSELCIERISREEYENSSGLFSSKFTENQENEASTIRIGFLSLDIEGYELQILQSIDYSTFLIDIIVVEHNYTSARKHISRFLDSKGFEQILQRVSGQDSWFVRRDIFKTFGV
jgi:hypothetical protein